MNNYTKERAQLILLSLLKQNGIRNIIASPGSTNISFVVSAQHDSFFKLPCLKAKIMMYNRFISS